ncbi:hypothetical protein [Hymenobacter persicinus]|uniref:Uncharacterized protein n=1 Tax=Hymenobacter persicinus TaxID=2025506 RepID=A0A4Q5L6Y7_9BACT|nr:hypothetical protein [Hymenobacter persicinus]RYU75449.1 hypothetical protein EWM57_19950 [Hymenobacter persicinus]
MKRLALALLLVLAAQASQADPHVGSSTKPSLAPSIRILDKKNGFREVTLGADIHTFRNLVLERTDASTQTTYYTRAFENLKVGSFRVTGISYGFYKDKLCSIEVRTMGDANCRAIHQFLLDEYGQGQRLASTKSEYWIGQQVSLRYTEVPQGYATVMLSSKSLMDQRMAERKLPAFGTA